MTYHVARNNQQIGTYPKEELINLYNAGTILPGDLVWTDGMATWEAASKVFGAPAVASAPPPFAPPPVTGVATPVNASAAERPAKPDNYLVWAILTTVLCCLPLGIVAIIFATQVDGKYHSGDYEGARAASGKAKTFSIISAVAGLLGVLIYAVVMIFAVAAGNAGGY